MKKFVSSILFILLSLVSYSPSFASENAVTDQASLKLIVGSYSDTGEIDAAISYQLQPGWKIYWRNAGDTGYPQNIDWSMSKNIKSLDIIWPAPQRFGEKIANFYSESYGYTQKAVFPLRILSSNIKEPVRIKLNIDYAICDKICIADKAEMDIVVPLGFKSLENIQTINDAKKLVPKENGSYGINIGDVNLGIKDDGGQYLSVSVTSDKDFKKADIFVEGGSSFAFFDPELVKQSDREFIFNVPVTFLNKDTFLDSSNLTITVKNGDESVEKKLAGTEIKSEHKAAKEPKGDIKLWLVLLFGFIGGFILNLMPCVLPVLAIKLMGIIKHSGAEKIKASASMIVTAFGIIISFILLAVIVIILRNAGVAVGWGFHFQQPLFIIFMMIVLLLFAANLLGLYEVKLPSRLNHAITQGNTGNFMSGMFATLLATPCTAPFLGVAVGFALSQGSVYILATFMAMGIGMSVPYIILSLFPNLVTRLPRAGSWMSGLKKFMAVLLVITAIWLGFVLVSQFTTNEENVTNFIEKEESWEPFRQDDIATLVENGKVVFVDVTASWCLTCKFNKAFILDSENVIEKFAEYGVVAMQADFTSRNEEIAQYLADNNRAGIPFNIVYGPNAPDGIILPELLTEKEVIRALEQAMIKK